MWGWLRVAARCAVIHTDMASSMVVVGELRVESLVLCAALVRTATILSYRSCTFPVPQSGVVAITSAVCDGKVGCLAIHRGMLVSGGKAEHGTGKVRIRGR